MIPLSALSAGLSGGFQGTYTAVSGWPHDFDKIATPAGVSAADVAPNGDIFMSMQHGPPHVTVWSPDGSLKSRWSPGTVTTPHGLRVRADAGGRVEVWVCDTAGTHQLQAFSAEGRLLRAFGQRNVSGTSLHPLQFGNIADVAFSRDGSKAVVVDGDGGPNNRVVVIDLAGDGTRALRSWGGIGGPGTVGRFNISHGVAVDGCDRVWVADRANRRVQVFTMEGKHLATWSCFDEQPYGLRMFPAAPGAPTASVLVTGGGAGGGVKNWMAVLDFAQQCDAPAALGSCAVAYRFEGDVDSTAHFSAIDPRSLDVYTCEVTINRFRKWAHRP